MTNLRLVEWYAWPRARASPRPSLALRLGEPSPPDRANTSKKYARRSFSRAGGSCLVAPLFAFPAYA
jgi:hypothetical protein